MAGVPGNTNNLKHGHARPARNKLPQLLVLVQNAGYPNVNAFLKANSISPATFYKLASGKGLRPATRARLSSLLGVEV